MTIHHDFLSQFAQTSNWLTNIFGDSTSDYIVNTIVITAVMFVLWRFLLEPVLNVLNGVRNFLRLRSQELVGLVITPPAQSAKSPLATEHLFTVLQKSLNRHNTASIELSATKKKGIRYSIVIPEYRAERLKKHIASYMPEVRFKVESIEDSVKHGSSAVHEIKQTRHYSYPLQAQSELDQSDPVSFLAGAMTQLSDDESVTLQMIVSPHYSRWTVRLYNIIQRKGHAVIDGKVKSYALRTAFMWVPGGLVWILTEQWAWGVIAAMFMGGIWLFSEKKEIELTKHQEEQFTGVMDKLAKPLMRTDIRLKVEADIPARAQELSGNFFESLAPFNTPGFQELKYARLLPAEQWQSYEQYKFSGRLPSLLNITSNIFSSTELASIYHFPYGTIQTEGMVRSHSKTLPAPLSMKQGSDFDVVIGVNKHHDQETPIGLSAEERQRHMYIVGGTGSGKTTMMKYQIVQDIRNGKGVAVVDPHGDLAEELLEYVPKSRKKDLIYLNPDDLDNPIGINLLEIPEGLSGNNLLREKDRVTESVISVMRKIFSEDDSGGHRIEYILRNTIQTALTLEKPTLFTIFRLLNDGKYAKSVIKKLEDEDLKAFWKNELGKAGSMQKVKMAAGITAKIGRFLFSASARAMLEKEESDIDFNEILDGKILICNFSKGRLGEDTSMLFGVTILAKLQLASLKRSEQKQVKRKPFYLYVDEFQNFATMSFVQMLSESRKYKLFLTMAEQSTQQQEDQKMINIILANVGTVVTFRSGSPRDEELLLPLFKPYVEQGEIANLPAYNFYCRVAAVEPQEPMSGETVLSDSEHTNFRKAK